MAWILLLYKEIKGETMEIDLTSCVVSKLKDTIVESKMHERALKDLYGLLQPGMVKRPR